MSEDPVLNGGRLAPVVVRLPVEIDIGNSAAVGDKLRAALAPGTHLVIADMTQTMFCDSSGLQQLARAHRIAIDLDIVLCLVSGGPSVTRVMTLTGLVDLIPAYASVGDALTAHHSPSLAEHEHDGGQAG